MTDDGPSFFAVPRGNTAQRERPRSPRRRRAAPDTTPPGNAYLAYYTPRYRALSHIGNVTKIASMVAAEWNGMDATARASRASERATAPQKPCFFETKKSPRSHPQEGRRGAEPAAPTPAEPAAPPPPTPAEPAAPPPRAGRAAAAPRPPSRPRPRPPSRPRRRHPSRPRVAAAHAAAAPRPPSRPSRVRHSGCCCWCFWCCCCLCFCCCCCCLCCFSC